jgi:hypothetical protein
VKVRIVDQLFQHKVSDIGARNFQCCGFVRAGKAVPILTSAIPICESGRPDDDPVETALLDVRLLTDMVSVRSAKEKPKHDVFPIGI